MRLAAAAMAILLLSACDVRHEDDAASQAPVPQLPQDHAALLASDNPQLAANKQLVYDMYRIVLQAGLADRAGEFVAVDYIQHNPNAEQGLSGLQDYVRATRPEREIEDRLELPLIHIMAEGDYVTTAFLRTETDADGATYYSTWFDLYRIEDGLIAEHWDPMLRTDEPIDPNEQRLEL